MGSTVELRKIDSQDLEVRVDEEKEQAKIIGYAAVFNRYSVDLGGFKEILRPGCFREALSSDDDVIACINHDRSTVFARKSVGNLTLEENQKGLKFEIDLIGDDPDSSRAYSKVKNGLMKDCSFAFRVAEDGEKINHKNGEIVREILKVSRLADVSVVTDGAYPATSVDMRNAEEAREAYLASLRAEDEEANEQEYRAVLDIERKKLELKEKEC